jgi:hypothetical protein
MVPELHLLVASNYRFQLLSCQLSSCWLLQTVPDMCPEHSNLIPYIPMLQCVGQYQLVSAVLLLVVCLPLLAG